MFLQPFYGSDVSSSLTKSDAGWPLELLFIFIIGLIPFHLFLALLGFSKNNF